MSPPPANVTVSEIGDNPTGYEAGGETGDADRGEWGSKTGFILSAVGSAVGLGNIWRFPLEVAENGGGAFVLLYMFVIFLIGLPALLAEMAVGRAAQKNAVASFETLGQSAKRGRSKRWGGVGILGLTSAITVMGFYAIIAGWALRYFVGSITGAYFDDPAAYLVGTEEGPNALYFGAITMGLVAATLMGGVQSGIERVNKVLMPGLFLVLIGLAIYALTLDNGAAGYSFMFTPDFSILTPGNANFEPGIFVAAAGQAFFSFSLGQGAMLTYASYFRKEEDLGGSASIIGVADLGIAILAGLIVFPIMFNFGVEAQAGIGTEDGGNPLLTTFIALPTAFSQMVGGQIVATVFFLGLFFAAFSSAISLLEVPTSWVVDRFELPRKKVAIVLAELVFLMGIGAAFNTTFLEFLDELAVNIFIPIGVLGTVLFAGYFMNGVEEELDRGSRFPWSKVVMPMIRYVIPVILAIIIVVSLNEFWHYLGELGLFGSGGA